MTKRCKSGPPKMYPRTLEVNVTEELYAFVTDLAKAMSTSKGGVLRALADAHKNHLTAMATDYVYSGIALAELEQP